MVGKGRAVCSEPNERPFIADEPLTSSEIRTVVERLASGSMQGAHMQDT